MPPARARRNTAQLFFYPRKPSASARAHVLVRTDGPGGSEGDASHDDLTGADGRGPGHGHQCLGPWPSHPPSSCRWCRLAVGLVRETLDSAPISNTWGFNACFHDLAHVWACPSSPPLFLKKRGGLGDTDMKSKPQGQNHSFGARREKHQFFVHIEKLHPGVVKKPSPWMDLHDG